MLASWTALLLPCFKHAIAQTPSNQQSDHSSLSAAALLHWPLSTGNQKYGAIDGKHLWQDVVEQARIAENYRDNGNSQFWGRISGTAGDLADARWLLNKYQQIGLTDTHIQTINYFA